MKKIFLLSFVIFLYSYDEPSAFGAGNLDSKTPYGLTDNEQHIYKNKKIIKDIENKLKAQEDRLRKEFYTIKSTVTSTANELDGLKTVLDGYITSKSKKIKESIKYQELVQKLAKDMNLLTTDINNLKHNTKEYQKANLANIEQLKDVLKELSKMIDNINNNYISLEEFRDYQKNVEKRFNNLTKNKISHDNLDKPNHTLYIEAIKYYKKKKYSKSKVRFTKLLKRNYKSATSSYYLGEIDYYSKKYSSALIYYKKSIKLYSKATYAPTLLLHTAISYDKQKKRKKAKKAYNFLIKMYPKSNSARIARKRLK